MAENIFPRLYILSWIAIRFDSSRNELNLKFTRATFLIPTSAPHRILAVTICPFRAELHHRSVLWTADHDMRGKGAGWDLQGTAEKPTQHKKSTQPGNPIRPIITDLPMT